MPPAAPHSNHLFLSFVTKGCRLGNLKKNKDSTIVVFVLLAPSVLSRSSCEESYGRVCAVLGWISHALGWSAPF